MPKVAEKPREGRSDGRPRARYTSRGVRSLKPTEYAKFDETVELAVRLGVNPKHADQKVRGAIVLPHGTGKTVRVLVFAKVRKRGKP